MNIHLITTDPLEFMEAQTAVIRERNRLADRLRQEADPSAQKPLYWVYCALSLAAGGTPKSMEALTSQAQMGPPKTTQKAAPREPLPLVTEVFGVPTVTSQQLAKSFGVRHDEMVTIVRRVAQEASPDFARLNFHEVPRLSKKGFVRVHFLVSRNGFETLLGASEALKDNKVIEKYFEAFKSPLLEGGAV